MPDIVQIYTAEQIRDMILAEHASQLGISDQALGSAVRTEAYAFASPVDELFYQLRKGTKAFYIRTATGYALSERAKDYGIEREAALSAIGYVTFTGTNGTSIPQGTQVVKPATQFSDEIVFVTTAAGTIASGTATVPIRAETAGASGNVDAASITALKNAISGVSSLTNASATLLGRDEEDDDALRSRILRTLAGLSRGTPPSIYAGAVDFRVQEVTLAGAISNSATDVPVYEDLNLFPIPTSGTLLIENEAITYTGITLTRDIENGIFPKFTGCTRGALSTSAVAHSDGVVVKEYVDPTRSARVESAFLVETPSSSHVDVYIADGSAQAAHSTLVSLVQDRLRGDATERNPGYRGAGITLDVHAASVTTIAVVVQVLVSAGYTNATVFAAVSSAIQRYINGLGVGEDVKSYRVAEAILGVEGVDNIASLTVAGTPFEGENATDTSISATTVARTSGASITVSA